MKKSLIFLFLVLLGAFGLFGCGEELTAPSATAFEDGSTYVIWGSVYDGVSGLDITTAANRPAVYVYVGGAPAAVSVSQNATLGKTTYWFEIKDNSEIQVQSRATGYVDFLGTFDADDIIVDAVDGDTGAETIINDSDTAPFFLTEKYTVHKDIVMYPTNASSDYTLHLYEANVAAEDGLPLTTATGSFRASVTSFTANLTRGYDYSEQYVDMSVTGTFAAGVATLPGTQLVLGATYGIYTYGVAGYHNNSAEQFTAGQEYDSDLVTAGIQGGGFDIYLYLDSTTNETDLEVVSYDNVDNEGNYIEGRSSINVAFNRPIELHPAFAVNAVTGLVTISTAYDFNGNGTTITQTADVASCLAIADYDTYRQNITYGPTNRCLLTVNGNVLTLQVTASAEQFNFWAADGAATNNDDISFGLNLDVIQVRAASTTEAFDNPMDDKVLVFSDHR